MMDSTKILNFPEQTGEATLEVLTTEIRRLAYLIEEGHKKAIVKKRWYNVKEAGEALGYSEKTIYRLKDRGLLKPSKATGKLLFPAVQIDTFAERTI